MRKLASCVITTKNEESVIKDILSSIVTQSYKNFEIVLVDNYSTDRTRQIAKGFFVRVFNKGPERSIQRNYGVEVSKGDCVLILDADMTLTKDVLKEGMDKFQNDSEVGALIVPEKSYGMGFWAKCKVFERGFYIGDETIEAPRFFKKSVFEKFGGYDDKITGLEDWDLPLRMKKSGVKIDRIKSVILHNERKFSPIKSAKKKYYYASHSKLFLGRHPEQIFTKGNLFFRPVFFKKWKELIFHPVLALGMFVIKFTEGIGALAGILNSGIVSSKL
ncbi:MAG: glycosyltransferase family A protein [Candidatus Woesebacteria bacterium]|nr:glycosyltransferase family A protein [Candidatus Woesebacteria bacterium]